MGRPVHVEPARPDELGLAFRLLFQHLPAAEQESRTANALRLVSRGELSPDGVLVVRAAGGLAGALVCMALPGAGGLIWPPQAAAGDTRPAVEDALALHALAWLSQRGAKLVQALLPPDEAHLAAPLGRNGFRRVTHLWYLRHHLDLPADLLRAERRLRYQSYAACDPALFHETLLQTYEGTLDCPEVSGVRSLDDVLEGHRAQGPHDPGRWWLALEGGRPAGVLIMAELPDHGAAEVSYVGVAPARRGRGLGRALMAKALVEARAREAAQLTLSVDARNEPAWKLYRRLGFETYDRREVFLAVLTPPAGQAGRR